MKKMATILGLVLISSSLFAADQSCINQLESIIYVATEAQRLESAAFHEGMNIWGEVDSKNPKKKHILAYYEISKKHLKNVEAKKMIFEQNCMK